MSTAAASVARRRSALAAAVRTGALEAARRSTTTRAPTAVEALRKRRGDGLVGSDGALIRDDFRAENEVAGTEPRIKAAAQTPTDDERRLEARRFRQSGAQG